MAPAIALSGATAGEWAVFVRRIRLVEQGSAVEAPDIRFALANYIGVIQRPSYIFFTSCHDGMLDINN